MLPTMAELIEAELPEHPIVGRSIWALMTGEEKARFKTVPEKSFGAGDKITRYE